MLTARDVRRAGGARGRPGGAVRRRRPRSARTPSSSPPACPTGSLRRGRRRRPDRPRRLLRLGADRGRRAARTRTSTSSAARTPPARPRCTSPAYASVGARCWSAGDVAGGVDVALPDRADRRDREHRGAHLHRGGRGARRRPPGAASRCCDTATGDRGTSTASHLFVFIGGEPADRLAGRRGRPRRARLRARRAGPARRTDAGRAGWIAGPRPVPPGDQRARRVRRRRRARRVGQAGRLRRRRGRDGRHARAPVPGGSDDHDRRPRVEPRRAARAVPVRDADRRAAGLAVRATATSWSTRAGPRVRRGRAGRPASTCCSTGTSALSRRVGGDDVEISRTDQRGVYAGAMQAYLGDRRARRSTRRRVVRGHRRRFFVLPRADVRRA